MSKTEVKIDSEYQLFQHIDWYSNTDTVLHEGVERLELGSNFGNCIYEVHKFVKRIIESEDLAFEVSQHANGKFEVKKMKFASYFDLLNAFIEQGLTSKANVIGNHAQLFYDAIHALNLEWMQFTRPQFVYKDLICEADLFNTLISWIREKSRTKEFKKKLSAAEYNGVRNLKSAIDYFHGLMARYSDLLILRVDLSYREEVVPLLTVDSVKKDFQRLLNNRRSNNLFKHCVGYVAKLECGVKKGLHFHVIFFFNGQKRQNDDWLADEIGIYWKRDITDGRGLAFNCNRQKDKYRQYGIGMLHYLDEKKANIFRNIVLPYLTKFDGHMNAYYPNESRLFSKGCLPAKKSNAGRKRIC
jgi:hypothetical protein